MKIDLGKHQTVTMMYKVITKTIAMATLVCFTLTSVCGQALQAAVNLRSAERDGAAEQTLEDYIVPPSYGRITDGKYYGSRQIVINIQDLHCHPEVQKNISQILTALDTRFVLKNVYVEGGYGDIDTSWLCSLTTRKLKSEVLENLVAQGKLTGAEYYSAVSNRPKLLKGIENESAHKANIVRLGRILAGKDAVNGRIDALNRDLEYMKAKYLGSRNKDLNRLIEGYRAGTIPTDRYYRTLSKYVKKINERPEKYNNSLPLSLEDYPNIGRFIELNRLSKRIDYRELRSQMQRFVATLRSVLPFSEYNDLLAKTGNFTRTDELCVYLARISRGRNLSIGADYPELKRFLEYAEKSRAVNPVQLAQEERRLVEEIRGGLSRNIRELEVSFLADFFTYFRDFLQNNLTTGDYEYFNQRFGKFQSIWRAYAFKDRLSGMDDDIGLLQAFYRANCQRNAYFIDNIAELRNAQNAGPAAREPAAQDTDGLNPVAPDLQLSLFEDAVRAVREDAEIIVIVTGGFHSDGLKDLLRERGISYLTILPAVTQDTGFSSETYSKLALAQASLLEKRVPGERAGRIAPISLALGLASQMSSRELFELELRAASRILSAAGISDRARLVEEIEKSTGLKVAYDAARGMITFDNGAVISLEEKEGQVQAAGISRGNALSPIIKTSIDGVLNTLAMQKAAASGDYYTLVKGVMTLAAEQYLLRGDGLIFEIENDPSLNMREKIDGIEKELLDRFPGFAQAMVAERERRKLDLESAAGRTQWLKTLMAVDLLAQLGFLPEKKGGQPGEMEVASTVKKYARPFVVTVDGYSGSGKSYISEKIARRTGAVYFSIGKVYRLLAYLAAGSKALNPSGGPLDLSAVPLAGIEKIISGFDLAKFTYEYVEGDLRYFYDGEDVTDAFYGQELSRNAAFIAKQEAVHRAVALKIRAHTGKLIEAGYSVVMEGKDAARQIWEEADAKLFIKTDSKAAATHRASRYMGTQGLKMDLRRAYFDVLGDEATEIEYEDLTEAEISNKISVALLGSLLEHSESDFEPTPGAVVLGSEEEGQFSVETLFEKAFTVVHDKAKLSFALERSGLRNAAGQINRVRAEKAFGSQTWRTVAIADTGLNVEVNRNETDVYLSDGMLGALLAESVSSLPAELQQELKRNGRSIKIDFFPEAGSRELFVYGDGYILINSAFKRLREETDPRDAQLAEMLFVTGIVKGLRKQFGEDFQWNSGVFAALARARGVPNDAMEGFFRRYVDLTGEAAMGQKRIEDRIWSALETGNGRDLPVTICLSDLHGEFDHFVGVLSVAMRHRFTPENIFEELDFMADSFKKAGIKVFINGDIPDRGPQMKKTFKLIRKLIDTGVGEYVTGNHDILAFMNLLGLHLPFYENYRGITKDYSGYCGGEGSEQYQNISRLLEAKRRASARGVNNLHSWAKKLQTYMNFADKRQKARQDPNNPEHLQPVGIFGQLFEQMYGFKLDEKKGKDVLNKPELDKEGKYFFQKDGKDPHKEKLLAWWKAILGRNQGVLVYTGTRAVEKMSIGWWEDRLAELDALLRDETDAGGTVLPGILSRNPEHAQDWVQLRAAVEKIIAEQKLEMQRRWQNGQWEWAVIDAIMYRNYESVEWYALDWVFHKGWGGLKGDGDEKGFLKQVNEKLKTSGHDHAYDASDYLGNIKIHEIRRFYMENFRLFTKDEYENVFIHAFLPVDAEGDVCIGRVDENGIVSEKDADGRRIKGLWYKGVHYAGERLFDGFERISEDVRGFRYGIDSLSDIQEALSLVMYIYADATTKIKPADLKKYKNLKGSGSYEGINGFDLIYRKLGVKRMFNGHNPVDKLADQGIGALEFGPDGSMLVQADFDFAPYYGHVGGGYVLGANGMEAVYYKAGSDKMGRVTILGADIYLGMVLAALDQSAPGAGVVHSIADLSAIVASYPSAVKTEPGTIPPRNGMSTVADKNIPGDVRIAEVRAMEYSAGDRRAKGRFVSFEPGTEMKIWVSREALEYDFSKYAPTPEFAEKSGKEYRFFPGLTVERFAESKDPLFAVCGHQSNFWMPNGALISDGRLVVKPVAGVNQSLPPVLDGEYDFFVLDPGAQGIRSVTLEKNRLRGTVPFRNAVNGPVLVRNGKRQDNLLTLQMPPLRSNEVPWDPRTKQFSFAVLGTLSDGKVFSLAMAGEPNDNKALTLDDIMTVLDSMGNVRDAILLGTSIDVQQYVDGHEVLKGFASDNSSSGKFYEANGGRTLASIIYAEKTPDEREGMSRTAPSLEIVHRAADKSAITGADTSAVKPEALDAARLFAKETRTNWGLWNRRGSSIFFALTIEENVKSFLSTYYGYYTANAPTADDIKQVLSHLDISFGGMGARDILAVFKKPKPATPPALEHASPAFPIAGYQRDKQEPKLPATTVGHMAASAELNGKMASFKDTPGLDHIWFSDLPAGSAEKLSATGINVVIGGRKVNVWLSDRDGTPVYFMDLRKAGVAEPGYEEALSMGAAQIIHDLAGTDNVPGSSGMRMPAMFVCAVKDREAVRKFFADRGINKPYFVDGDTFEGVTAADAGPLIERILIKHNAVSMAMAENKILKMDISDIQEFDRARAVFIAVGNGQMMVDWNVFAKALAGEKIDERQIEWLLKDARGHGVIVHVEYKPSDAGSALATVKKLYRLGFQGVSLDVSDLDAASAQTLVDALKNYPLTAVTAPAGIAVRARRIRLSLHEVKTTRFSADDVIDLQIPRGLSDEQMRDYMRYLPLSNTIIIHSADAASLIGGTKDILDKKIFASLLNSLLNFGISNIGTTEKARRLGYVWNAADLPDLLPGEAGKKQIALMRAGDFSALSAIRVDVSEAIREQAAELSTPELKNAFLHALAEKMLVREWLSGVDKELGAAYAKGTYSIKSARHEEMLGAALARLLEMSTQEAETEKTAYAALKAGYRGSASSLLIELSAELGRPGFATAVIEIVPPEILLDYTAGKTKDSKPGTLDINTTRSMLGAA